ncbi:MAG: transglutaminase-like domain-containing protein [Nitrospinota bacterium]|nr:transglutaminase-like domain-containing protein [Nitrospinota bacterium]
MNPHSQPTEISSLIRLLDDRDPYVTDQVGNRLVEWGSEAVPFLEIASRSENQTLKTRALKILERIAPQQLAEAFRNLARAPAGEDVDLEQGVILLMQFGHPSAEPDTVRRQLDQLAEGLAKKLTPETPPEEALAQLTGYLFSQQGFRGNQDNYADPDNSYFDTVLKNKTGLPISLSTLCILIGQRLQLPIVGVGLPYHFIAQYHSSAGSILFDPFHRGRILTPEQCSEMVRGFGVKFEPHFLSPVSHREILTRMIQNLVIAYQKLDEKEKVVSLKNYSKILMR